jgi:hypothetical protein
VAKVGRDRQPYIGDTLQQCMTKLTVPYRTKIIIEGKRLSYTWVDGVNSEELIFLPESDHVSRITWNIPNKTITQADSNDFVLSVAPGYEYHSTLPLAGANYTLLSKDAGISLWAGWADHQLSVWTEADDEQAKK